MARDAVGRVQVSRSLPAKPVSEETTLICMYSGDLENYFVIIQHKVYIKYFNQLLAVIRGSRLLVVTRESVVELLPRIELQSSHQRFSLLINASVFSSTRQLAANNHSLEGHPIPRRPMDHISKMLTEIKLEIVSLLTPSSPRMQHRSPLHPHSLATRPLLALSLVSRGFYSSNKRQDLIE